MPFLRGTTPIWGTQDLPGRCKEWKARLVEIGQTSHKVETNAHANFPMAENLAYECMENGGRNMPTVIFLWLTCLTFFSDIVHAYKSKIMSSGP